MNEESIFLEALGKADAGERAHYLDRACAGDAVRRRRIEQLLSAASSSSRRGGISPGEEDEGSPAGASPEPRMG